MEPEYDEYDVKPEERFCIECFQLRHHDLLVDGICGACRIEMTSA